MEFHEHLRAIRTSAQKTQQQLAEFLNVSTQSVSKWETGHSLPSIEYLLPMAKFFDCCVEAFFNDGILHLYETYGPESIRLFSFVSQNIFEDKEIVGRPTLLLDAGTAAALCDLLCKKTVVTPSVLQKSLHVGYAIASCILDDLRRNGIIDPEGDPSQNSYGKVYKEKISSLISYY